MRKRPKNASIFKNRAFILALIPSLLIHIIFGLLLVVSLKSFKKENKPKYTKVELKYKQKKDIKEKDLNSKQLVSINPDNNQKKPKKANFIAEFNQSTDLETKSPISSLRPKKISKIARKKGLNTYLREKNYNKENDPLGLFKVNELEGSIDDALPFSDNLDKVKSGTQTILNAWQWQHAPFFNRLKERVALNWSPKIKIERYDQAGQLLGVKDRVTVLEISINKSGDIVDLDIIKESGVSYLDDEAIDAFKRSAPFLFPPKELFIDKDEFSFKFAFYLQVTRGLRFNIDW